MAEFEITSPSRSQSSYFSANCRYPKYLEAFVWWYAFFSPSQAKHLFEIKTAQLNFLPQNFGLFLYFDKKSCPRYDGATFFGTYQEFKPWLLLSAICTFFLLNRPFRAKSLRALGRNIWNYWPHRSSHIPRTASEKIGDFSKFIRHGRSLEIAFFQVSKVTL